MAEQHPAGLQVSSTQEQGRPQLLVCHDLAGGYHQDAYVQVAVLQPVSLTSEKGHSLFKGPMQQSEMYQEMMKAMAAVAAESCSSIRNGNVQGEPVRGPLTGFAAAAAIKAIMCSCFCII